MSDSAGETSLRSVFPVTLLVALAALAAVGPLATDTYLPAFAQMATDLKASASGIQLTMTTFLVGIAAGQLLIGMLSDRFGRRPLLVWGTLLALAAGIGTVVAPGLVTLLAARFLQGLGGAAGMVLGRAVISDRARGATATQALSVVMAIQGVAPVVAPILGGVLMDFIGWRGIMAVVAGFTLVMLLMVLAWVPESLPSQDRSSGGLKELARGTRELMRDGIFVRLVSVNALVFALLMCFLSAAPFILKNVLGMATGPYTLVFGACGLTVTVSVGIAGSLVRRVPPARQVRIGLAAQLVVDLVFAGVCLAWLGSPIHAALGRGDRTRLGACGLPGPVFRESAGPGSGTHRPPGRDRVSSAGFHPVRRRRAGESARGAERRGIGGGLRGGDRGRGSRSECGCAAGDARPWKFQLNLMTWKV